MIAGHRLSDVYGAKNVIHGPGSVAVPLLRRRFPDFHVKSPMGRERKFYVKVKANSSRYTLKQGPKDRWIGEHLDIRTHLMRVEVDRRRLVCLLNCPDLTAQVRVADNCAAHMNRSFMVPTHVLIVEEKSEARSDG